MIKAATLPLVAPRHAPFVYRIEIPGISLSGALLDMHVRLTYDTPGTPLIDLNLLIDPDVQGLSLAIDSTGPFPVSTIQIRINKETLQDMPAADEIGNDAVFYYDLHVTPPGGDQSVWFRGTFTVQAGATF